jgi:hypothetical protein
MEAAVRRIGGQILRDHCPGVPSHAIWPCVTVGIPGFVDIDRRDWGDCLAVTEAAGSGPLGARFEQCFARRGC